MPRACQPRTVPCERCRALHVTCHWGDTATCTRCTSDDAECSGPQRKPRSTKPPCESCKRKRTRCVWTEDETMCLRCKNRGLGVCPIPPRSQTSLIKPQSISETPRQSIPLTIIRSDTWESLMTDNLRENLTTQGRVRLGAAGFSCLPQFADRRGRENEVSVDGFLSMIFAISGLKFSNVTSDNKSEHQPTVQILDTASTTRWLANPVPKAEVLQKGLMVLFPGAWRSIERLVSLGPLEGYNLQRILGGLLIFIKLSIVPTAELNTIRMVLACVVMATAVELRKDVLRPGLVKDFSNIALKLIIREHHYSVTLGEKSWIAPWAYDEILAKVLETASMSLGSPSISSLEPPGIDSPASSLHSILHEHADHIITSTETTLIGLSKEITTLQLAQIPAIRDRLNQLHASINTLTLLADDPAHQGVHLYQGSTTCLLPKLRMLELQIIELDILITIAANRHALLLPDLQGLLVAVAGDMALEALNRIVRVLRVILAPKDTRVVDLYPSLDAVGYILALGKACLPAYMCRLDSSDASLVVEALTIGLFWECRAATLVSLYSAGKASVNGPALCA